MKSVAAVLLIAAPCLAIAQDRMADTLRKGVLEEESNQNLGAAIRAYESVVSQFDEARKTAATALFRLAESYRKQGNKDKAIAAHKRVVKEFPDQATLAEQSRNRLAKTFNLPQESPAGPAEPPEVPEARKQYRAILEAEIKLAEEELKEVEKDGGSSTDTREKMRRARQRIIEAQRALAAFDLGYVSPRR